ncbi:MAG: glycoside hydrolase family 2 TIM barrel-domain containing protein, partial [Planctomycetota bacterium]|nr:glycoside hydrolase family 2 TIM barrel-domain containing protein [Planctomycetota bacterium]
YDLTPHITAGEPACIAVRADNSRQKNSRWYSGSGIYRHVWLTTAGPVRVDHWGTYVTTPEVSAEEAVLRCVTTVVNDGDEECCIGVLRTLIHPDAQEQTSQQEALTIDSKGATSDVEHELKVINPELWSPDTPCLYTLRTELVKEGAVIDSYETQCGIRSIRFDANEGFFLNEQSLKLQGVNEHHDAGCLGAAVPDDVIRRRFRILKKMGCNAIRIAHNPASTTFLDLCDEFGFMVVEDAFDEWKDSKTPYGYGLYWDEWWERDLTDMIRRDRNHPCIVMWSVGNEIKEVRSGRPEGLQLMAALQETCHRVDPTRPMTCGCCAIRETNAAGYGPLMDVVGYNGGGGSCFDYEKDHATYPDRVIFASEVPHSLQTRGVYRTQTWYRDLARNPNVERLDVPHLTEEELFTDFDDHYKSSYDNAMVRISSIDSWRLTKTLPFMCGEFRWSGFDYLGECYGWPAKSWNFGVIDLCGFPKDTYFFYQSQWTDAPMVHFLPHWTWPGLEGKEIPMICYTNCERVELFLDDESLGTEEMGDRMYLRWDVAYRPGKLRAVGYREGKEVAICMHETASAPSALKLVCDERDLSAGKDRIAHVAITVVDAKGLFVPYANNEVSIEVRGPARLLGMENGDPIDTTNYKLSHRRTFNGMALAILEVESKRGAITMTASAPSLGRASCECRAGED